VIAASIADPERFAIIYDRHAGPIHRYLARRLGGQTADDLVGETFLHAFRRRQGYDGSRAEALPWLYGIATLVIAQHRREEARAHRLAQVTPVPDDVPAHADQVSTDVTAAAQRDRLLTALGGLNPADRDVLLLVAQEELTYEQVAAALDIPVGTVRSRLHRARVTIRAALGGANPMNAEDPPNPDTANAPMQTTRTEPPNPRTADQAPNPTPTPMTVDEAATR
jgi:RNA polymerase sigma factor (sigma-70 family)